MTLNEQIAFLYYDKLYSTRQVAKELNISTSAVSKVLKEHYTGCRNRSAACNLRTTSNYCTKLSVSQQGDNNNQRKLSSEEVIEIRELYEEMIKSNTKLQSQYMLAQKFGVRRPTISDIVLRRTWKHI
ncbi:UNVERIFIED_CONTAM: putative transcriptional regulator [Paenibacillus sp. PvR008]